MTRPWIRGATHLVSLSIVLAGCWLAASEPASGQSGKESEHGESLDRFDHVADWFHSARDSPPTPGGDPRHFLLQAIEAHRKFMKKGKRIGGSWRPLGPERFVLSPTAFGGGLGRLNAVAVHPHDSAVIYAGAAAGPLWKSIDSGLSWEPEQKEAGGISGIVIDPPETVYALTGDGNGFAASTPAFTVPAPPSRGVLKSTDGGKSWKLFPITEGRYYGYDLVIDPGDRRSLLAATNQGIFRSTDGGMSWKQVQSGYFFDVDFRPCAAETGSCAAPSTVYASTATEMWKSTDGGANWRMTFDFSEELGYPEDYEGARTELAVTVDEPDTVYAVFGGYWGFGGFFHSGNGGESFTLRSQAPPNIFGALGPAKGGGGMSIVPAYALAMTVSPGQPWRVYVGCVNLWVSANRGETWDLATYWDQRDPKWLYRNNHGDIHALEFHEDALYSATDGGLYLRTDSSSQVWSNLSEGLVITQPYRICGQREDADYLYFGAQDVGTNQLLERSAVQFGVGDGMECLTDPSDPDVVYFFLNSAQLNKTSDGGKSSADITPPASIAGRAQTQWLTPLALYRQTIFACYKDVVAVNMFGGLSGAWRAIKTSEKDGLCVQLVAAPAASTTAEDEATLYMAKQEGVYLRPWTGSTEEDWTSITAGLPVLSKEHEGIELSDLAVDAESHSRLWVTLTGYHDGEKVYVADLSQEPVTWTNVSGSLPNLPVNSIVFAGDGAGGVYVGMDRGVYYRNDHETGGDWALFGGELPGDVVMDLLIQEDKQSKKKVVRAGTFSWGLWEVDGHVPGSSLQPPRPGKPKIRPPRAPGLEPRD